MMGSIAELGSLDERNGSLLGHYYSSSHLVRKDGKSNSKRFVGAAEESVTASGLRRKAHEDDWWFERSVAQNACDMANHSSHENNIKIYGWPSFAEAAPVTVANDVKWFYEPYEWIPERRRIQGGVSYTGNGYKQTSKPAMTSEFPSSTSTDCSTWRILHHPQHPHWRRNEQVDFPSYQRLSIPDAQLIIHNTPPSSSTFLDTHPSNNSHQASTPPGFYRSNPTQPCLPQQPICGKSLEMMEVEAAFILMLIRHQTPEAAAVAIARELRLAQEEQQFRRAGSPCGSEDTVVGSEYDDGEGWFGR